jgi:single-stranded DNA-binding protein
MRPRQKLIQNIAAIGGNLASAPMAHLFKRGKDQVPGILFRIALDDGTRDIPHTTLIDCLATGRTAEQVKNWFAEGDRILIDGHLRTEEVKGKAGLYLIVETVHLVEDLRQSLPDRSAKQTTRAQSRIPQTRIALDTGI